jgi:hypothetical protein
VKLLIPDRPALIAPKRYAGPTPPQTFVDATIEWARKSGRTVWWKWSADMGCWTVNLSLPPTAPAMRDYQEGRLKQADPPTEGVALIEQVMDASGVPTGEFKALDLEQYGPSGIVRMLEEADLWSGRGTHRSLQEFVQKTAERNRENTRKIKARQKAWAHDLAMEFRRQICKIPLIRAGIQFSKER